MQWKLYLEFVDGQSVKELVSEKDAESWGEEKNGPERSLYGKRFSDV